MWRFFISTFGLKELSYFFVSILEVDSILNYTFSNAFFLSKLMLLYFFPVGLFKILMLGDSLDRFELPDLESREL